MCKREHTVSTSYSYSHGAVPFRTLTLVYRPTGFDDSFKRGSAAYTLEDSEEQRFATLAVLECRGCELTEFDTKVGNSRAIHSSRLSR